MVGKHYIHTPDNKVHGANMGPTWVLSAPDGPHVGPMNLAIRDTLFTVASLTLDQSSYYPGANKIHAKENTMHNKAGITCTCIIMYSIPDNKVHGTWVLSAPDGPYVGPMNFAIWDVTVDLVTL